MSMIYKDKHLNYFENSEFAENFKGEEFDRWYDDFQEEDLIPLLNQRALPGETYVLDETEETPLLPDYTVTDEDMHDYGYTKDEMLPLHKRAAQRLWGFGLEINKLSHDNTEKAVEIFSELTPTERTLYGIRKEVWMNYLNNEKTSPYLWARKVYRTYQDDCELCNRTCGHFRNPRSLPVPCSWNCNFSNLKKFILTKYIKPIDKSQKMCYSY